MLRVKLRDLRENMIIAEPILDVTGKVLLDAKARLTKSNIELLRTWEIDFVRIREAKDTDETIAKQLQLEKQEAIQRKDPGIDIDYEIEKRMGITEAGILSILKGEFAGGTSNWKPERKDANGLGSLVSQEGIAYYYKLLNIVLRLLENNTKDKEFSVKEWNEVARVIADYVISTPGVIGYTMLPIHFEYKELARHILSTTVVAGKIAMLLTLSSKEINNIILASLLHDIGKIGLPENIVNKSARFTPDEEKLYQSHVSLGIARLKGRTWLPKEVLLAVAQHHEQMDGKGFPLGFTGDKIHSYAKIIAFADYFDSAARGQGMDAVPLPELINRLPHMLSRFDSVICEVFTTYLKDFLLSNTVELEDGRTAHIVYMHQAFTKPVIRTDDGEFIDLNTCRDIKIEKYTI